MNNHPVHFFWNINGEGWLLHSAWSTIPAGCPIRCRVPSLKSQLKNFSIYRDDSTKQFYSLWHPSHLSGLLTHQIDCLNIFFCQIINLLEAQIEVQKIRKNNWKNLKEKEWCIASSVFNLLPFDYNRSKSRKAQVWFDMRSNYSHTSL